VRLASRGLRDMDDGAEPLDTATAAHFRVKGTRVHLRALAAAFLATAGAMILP